MDSETKCLSEITGTNRVLIQGQKLGISPDNPDEGVWLVDCVFETPPEPGAPAFSLPHSPVT